MAAATPEEHQFSDVEEDEGPPAPIADNPRITKPYCVQKSVPVGAGSVVKITAKTSVEFGPEERVINR